MTFPRAYRVALFLAILLIGAMITQTVKPLADAVGVEDGLQMFFGCLVFVKAWRPSVRLFTDKEFQPWRLWGLFAAFVSASYIGAAIWAISWRSLGYSTVFADNELRFAFRYLAICGLMCAIAAPEFSDEVITRKRVARLAVGFFAALLTVVALLYGGRLGLYHDRASAPVQKEHVDG